MLSSDGSISHSKVKLFTSLILNIDNMETLPYPILILTAIGATSLIIGLVVIIVWMIDLGNAFINKHKK